MTRSLGWVFFVFGIAVPAAAQTHPCDSNPPPNIRLTKNTAIVGFCHDQKDQNGTPEPAGALTFQPALDGLRQGAFVALAPQGGANTAGQFYFEFPVAIPVSRGNHTVTVWTKDPDGEIESAPYPFVVSGPGPTAATGARVR